MVRRLLVGVREREQTLVRPQRPSNEMPNGYFPPRNPAGTVTCGRPVIALSSHVPGSSPYRASPPS